MNTEKTIYVGVFVVEHLPGRGAALDDDPAWMHGVRANLVQWIDGAITDEGSVDEENFYRVRDVTLYSEQDLMLELETFARPSLFPDVQLQPEEQ